MSRRPLLLMPALLTALALPVAPALAGEDDGDDGNAALRASQGCVTGTRAKATVTGDDITRVAFVVDGKAIRTVTRPTVRGTWVFTMRCSRLTVGAHRARAVVSFEGGARQTLRFQIARARQSSPRFTG